MLKPRRIYALPLFISVWCDLNRARRSGRGEAWKPNTSSSMTPKPKTKENPTDITQEELWTLPGGKGCVSPAVSLGVLSRNQVHQWNNCCRQAVCCQPGCVTTGKRTPEVNATFFTRYIAKLWFTASKRGSFEQWVDSSNYEWLWVAAIH